MTARHVLSAKPCFFALSVITLAACGPGTPRIDGVPGAPPSPSQPWREPAQVMTPPAEAAAAATPPALPQTLSIADVVDIALRNNPATQISWAQARSAADLYGAARGTLLPTVNGNVVASRSTTTTQTTQNPAASKADSLTGTSATSVATNRKDLTPSITLNYLLLDFGGRNANIDVARQTAIAADLSHNATIETTILTVEDAAFNFLASRALRDAQRISVDQARTALDAANARHNVGVATVADVLQAQTALSQAELQLESLQGTLDVTRGSLAANMGLPANAHFDIPEVPADTSVYFVTDSVDAFIGEAVRFRPELAAARAQAKAASDQIAVARSAEFPSLNLSSTASRDYAQPPRFNSRQFSMQLGLQVPIFNGFTRDYNLKSAQDLLIAANARTELTRQQIEFQVFSSYYSLRTSTDRVRTSEALLASATESERVARGRYQEGVGSIVDLLIAQSALASARAQEIDARWTWRMSLAQLAHDVGTLGLRGEPILTPTGPAR